MFARSLPIAIAISALSLAAHAVEERFAVANPLTNYEILKNLNRIAFMDKYRGTKGKCSEMGPAASRRHPKQNTARI